MNYTIDASIFVSAARSDEVQHLVSLNFLDQLQTQEPAIFCPALVLPECAAAITRQTKDIALAERLTTLIENFPGLNLIPLSLPLARRAAQIATAQQLRGADAIYVAVAEEFNALLVTWDAEMLASGPAVTPTTTPQAWLDSQTDNP